LRKVAEEASQARQIDAARRAEAEAAARNLQATLKNFQQKVDSSRAQAAQQFEKFQQQQNVNVPAPAPMKKY
ncbi:MAG TPA: hypothetical protein VN279_01180, partial [Rhodocyclaceae bacterium]|nr:hypothetical protein [Rhodocyclaceae bacterium]